jgi:hypothetical protein
VGSRLYGLPRPAQDRDFWEPFALFEDDLGGYRLSDLQRGRVQVGTKPRAVDGEDLEDFYQRWIEWFARLLMMNSYGPEAFLRNSLVTIFSV